MPQHVARPRPLRPAQLGASPRLTRRYFLGGLVAAPAAATILAGCGESASTAAGTTTSTAAGTTATTAAGSTSSTAAATGSWLSGGTDLISVAYPDDSIFATANTCSVSLTNATTEGPCYFQDDTGEDISDGKTGLPMQLCLQLVDEACSPLEGYTVEVWHCDTRGIYSGDTSSSADASSFAGDFCTAGDTEAEAATYFRGQLTTDAAGRVNFLTCFPGWYSGRSIHIHFAVSDPDGTTRVISQWAFSDDFTEDICTTHELYADRGVQDTPLEGGTDTVFPSDSYEDYELSLEQNSDGSLLGYGVIMIDPDSVATEAAGGAGGAPGGDRPERP